MVMLKGLNIDNCKTCPYAILNKYITAVMLSPLKTSLKLILRDLGFKDQGI